MKRIFLMIVLMFISADARLPTGFVYVQKQIPSIEIELKYHGEHNFVGSLINGYLANSAILTLKASIELSKVQKELKSFGLGLKIFDAYRPQKAVNHFVRWGKELTNKKMKIEYYPRVAKKNLFKEGYIAKKSGHSRGSTVDLTLIDLSSKKELDMGSDFDFFGKLSWFNAKNITEQQRANRMLLKRVMLKYGFKSYLKEWWHFTLKNEPYQKKYFDFNVK